MNTATFVARYLGARGVRWAFGHPGSDVMELIEAMDRCGIEYVLTHHENTGAFMAAAVGRATGIPGVVLVTKGPGITNVATGVGSAHLDRAPLLCFSSHVKAPDTARTVRQHVPAVRFYEPITKLSAEMTAANVHELLPRAYRITISPYPGPAYLPSLAAEQVKDVPVADGELDALIERGLGPEPVPVPDADGALPAALADIAAARRLAVVVGPGVEHAHATAELLDAIAALGAPTCVTPEAIGLVPADHPLYAGMVGWHDAPLRELLGSADVLLTIGLDGADVMVPYRGPARVVALGPLALDEAAYAPVAHAVGGDLRRLLPALAERGRGERDWGEAKAAAVRAAHEANMAVTSDHVEDLGIAPQRAVTELRAASSRETVFVCDVGAHKIVAGATWKSYAPGTFFISNGFGSMGYGLATAMGVKLARPGAPVVCVVGDGGLLMYAGDLATWARLRLPLVLVVMVDNDLTQVRRRQERKGYSIRSTTFQRIDYGALARSFGIDALRASNAVEYRVAVAKAIAADRPMVIEAFLDPAEYRRIPGWV